MKLNQIFIAFILLAAVDAAGAQTNSTPIASTAKPATTTAKPATTTTHTATATHTAAAAGSSATKLPPGVPVVKGIVKTAFTLRYEEIIIGKGADAEPNKLYKVNYTGYLGANGRPDDGHRFDSSFDHRMPIIGKDGKPEMDEDGKPKLGDPQPIVFPQGMRQLIPGFDQGFEGMKVGGKRRLFIPWQLAYGATGRPPVIPAKADLIFDVELVDVSDLPTPPRPAMPPTAPSRPFGSVPPKSGSGAPAGTAVPPATGAVPAAPSTPPAPSSPTAPTAPAQPAQPATSTQPQAK